MDPFVHSPQPRRLRQPATPARTERHSAAVGPLVAESHTAYSEPGAARSTVDAQTIPHRKPAAARKVPQPTTTPGILSPPSLDRNPPTECATSGSIGMQNPTRCRRPQAPVSL